MAQESSVELLSVSHILPSWATILKTAAYIPSTKVPGSRGNRLDFINKLLCLYILTCLGVS